MLLLTDQITTIDSISDAKITKKNTLNVKYTFNVFHWNSIYPKKDS